MVFHSKSWSRWGIKAILGDGAHTVSPSTRISPPDRASKPAIAPSSVDYLIYNGAIENGLSSVQDLVEKSDTFADFKAVKDGNVWQVGKAMYQSTDTVGQFITDVHLMLTGGDESQMTFLSKVAS